MWRVRHVLWYVWELAALPILLALGMHGVLSAPLTSTTVLLGALVGAVLQGRGTYKGLRYDESRGQFARASDAATAALVAGRTEEALEHFRAALVPDETLLPYARLRLGHTLRRLGRHELASSEFYAAATTGYDPRVSVHAFGAVSYAESLVLLGRLDDADKVLAWADQIVGLTTAERAAVDVERACVKALLKLRRGEPAEALRLLAVLEDSLAHARPLNELQEVWLWRAFAETLVASPREAQGAERWLTLLRLSTPRHLAGLASAWPDLADFLARHELAPAAVPAA